jgi:hypothetical protein
MKNRSMTVSGREATLDVGVRCESERPRVHCNERTGSQQ